MLDRERQPSFQRGRHDDALPHRRQPLLDLALHRARRVPRPHPRCDGDRLPPCPPPMAASRQRMAERASRPPAAAEIFSPHYDEVERAHRHAISWPSARTTRPRSATASNWRARMPAPCAPRSPSRCGRRSTAPGSSCAATSAPTSDREEFARFLEWVKYVSLTVRRLGLPDHAAQRRLLVLPARRRTSSGPTTPPASST